MMNGGQKQYIGKDGFWRVHNATPAEEEEWAKELLENSFSKIGIVKDPIALQAAIENLTFHKYQEQVSLLVNSLDGASPGKQLTMASALWGKNCNEHDFDIVFNTMLQHNATGNTELFDQPANFKHPIGARYFLINCLHKKDEYLFEKAQNFVNMGLVWLTRVEGKQCT